MCNVDITFPGVTAIVFGLVEITLWFVDTSVWVKGVVWLLSVQVMVGTGTPVEVQEMSTFPPSLMTTPLLPFVMASTKTALA